MTDSRPIGIFDSGVGGLTVLRAIHDRVPAESTIYVGDLAYFPYGPRPSEEVRTRALAIAAHLTERDVKALVVACNTATSAALEDVERFFPGPVIGVVAPGAEEAVARSRDGIIGVVATAGTVRCGAYKSAIAKVEPACSVMEIACDELVRMVESGQGQSDPARLLVRSLVAELVDRDCCDTIILGCTHFPLVRNHFEDAAGSRAVVVDSATSTSRRLTELLFSEGANFDGSSTPTHTFLTTSHADSFVHQARTLFGERIQASVVEIETPTLAAALT